MTVHTIDIDSGERDASLYPNPNAYTIDLKTPVFDVTSLEVTTARFPTQPFVIHDNNNKFSVRIDAPAPDAGTQSSSPRRATDCSCHGQCAPGTPSATTRTVLRR